MATRYCFNPKDPHLRRFVLTKALMDEKFVECPPPDQKLPAGLLGGIGGALSNAAVILAQEISKKLGPNATEDQIKAVSMAIGRMDPENLAALAEPVQQQPAITTPAPLQQPIDPIDPETVGAMGSAMDVAPPADKIPATEPPVGEETPEKETLTEATGILEMHQVPQVETTETVDSATKRMFGKRLEDISKIDILNHGLMTVKVKLDSGKTKPLLIRDLQLVELANQNQEA